MKARKITGDQAIIPIVIVAGFAALVTHLTYDGCVATVGMACLLISPLIATAIMGVAGFIILQFVKTIEHRGHHHMSQYALEKCEVFWHEN